ncbi:MAG TPA: hypothetical protein PLN36_07100 [Bacteroidales bacterium]|nr:hypothetical protein [Bacteroidales bacterium]HRS68457.1 hypothetical protein [Paludibacteraceae bacterium]
MMGVEPINNAYGTRTLSTVESGFTLIPNASNPIVVVATGILEPFIVFISAILFVPNY